jgi:hypothetical protein
MVMSVSWKNRLPWALVAVLVVIALLAWTRFQPASAARDDAAAAPGRYSVIDTEAHNLIVVDNKSNTLYFYTIDRDKEVGSDLKLRATIDLNQVGKPTIKPEKAKAE